jgi:hypothetical protein
MLAYALRQFYVRTMRALRSLAGALGILATMERSPRRWVRWLRSLFAIYDIDDLVHLDLPWWTFEAVDVVDDFLRCHPNARVFEWGSGASTVWLARRAGKVMSIEHDAAWADRVRARLIGCGNVELRVVPATLVGRIASTKRGFAGQYFDDYVAALAATPGDFDLIVIDGRAREACLAAASAKLAPGGAIIFDDTCRQRYRTAIAASGLHLRRCSGLAVCLPYYDATDILTAAAH